jgi:pilus assembly protein Flp/PilA
MADWVERCAYSILAGALDSDGNGLIQEAPRMALIRSILATLKRDEDGQGLAEYALILALIAIVAIIALIFLGGQVSTILSTVGASI